MKKLRKVDKRKLLSFLLAVVAVIGITVIGAFAGGIFDGEKTSTVELGIFDFSATSEAILSSESNNPYVRVWATASSVSGRPFYVLPQTKPKIGGIFKTVKGYEDSTLQRCESTKIMLEATNESMNYRVRLNVEGVHVGGVGKASVTNGEEYFKF